MRELTTAVLLLLTLAATAPALAAGGPAGPEPRLTLPAENISLAQAAAADGHGTLASLEAPGTVTIFHIDGPPGVYPGARPGVEGPLYLELSAQPGLLIILAAIACIFVAGYRIYKRKNRHPDAGSEPGGSPE
jgi:hypothetical protein